MIILFGVIALAGFGIWSFLTPIIGSVLALIAGCAFVALVLWWAL